MISWIKRHGEDDQQAARIAPDLDHFLARHGEDAAQVHAALPGLDSRVRGQRDEDVFEAGRNLFQSFPL